MQWIALSVLQGIPAIHPTVSTISFFTPFHGIQLLVVTVLSHRYNSRTGSGETKVERHAYSETQPNQAALLLNTAHIQPGSQQHQCVGENPLHLATWLECTAPGPPQESLVRDETRISLRAKPSLTRTTLGQLCIALWTSRSGPAATQPRLKPESLVAQLALRCSALDHCATWEVLGFNHLSGYNISNALLYKHTHRVSI